MPNRNFRVIARQTTYYYVDVVATSKATAVAAAFDIPQNMFTLIDDPQKEFRVLSAAPFDAEEPVDALDFLTRGTK